MFKEYLKRRSKIKAFSRAQIEPIHDHDFFLEGNIHQTSILWHVLSDQAIGIFIGATFSGRIRMSEVKIHGKRLRDVLMSSEFFAIVSCDAFKRRYPVEQINDSLADQFGLFTGSPTQEGET